VESALEEVLSEDYTGGGALFIACGVLLVAVSIVGIIGAWGKWRPLLLTVSCLHASIVAILTCVVFSGSIPCDRFGDCCSGLRLC